MNGILVLQNKKGQVVRSFQWKGKNLFLVYRHDNRRVEAVSSTKDLDADDIGYTLLTEVSKDEIQKRPVSVGQLGQLKWQDEVESTARNLELQEESDEPFITSLKWTTGIQAAIVILCLLLGYFTSKNKETEEPIVVQVFERPPVLEPITKKVSPKNRRSQSAGRARRFGLDE
jgi:hypothetical protein